MPSKESGSLTPALVREVLCCWVPCCFHRFSVCACFYSSVPFLPSKQGGILQRWTETGEQSFIFLGHAGKRERVRTQGSLLPWTLGGCVLVSVFRNWHKTSSRVGWLHLRIVPFHPSFTFPLCFPSVRPSQHLLPYWQNCWSPSFLGIIRATVGTLYTAYW